MASAKGPGSGSGATEARDGFPSYEELAHRPGPLAGTAWGVFGEDDQLGTLNHLTPSRVAAAATLVREGVRFGLNLPLDAFDPPLIAHRGAIQHHVFGLNEFHRDESLDNLFTQASTQLDGLRHFAHPDHGFYNGVAGSDVAAGTLPLGIQNVAACGIAGRGVLVDVARYRESIGHPIDHDGSERIPVADIEATLVAQDIEISPGDIVMFRFGWLDWFRQSGHARARLTSAGLDQSEQTAAWLWDHRLAVAASDNIALEAWPADPTRLVTNAERGGSLGPSSHTGMLHRILIPLLGLTIGELWDLEPLAVACLERKRYEVFVVAEPLNISGGVGSPANALALL